MKLFKAINERRKISRQHSELKNLSDRTLEDIGYSPTLIRMGRSGFPWKLPRQ